VKKAEKEDREQRQYDMDDAAVALTKVNRRAMEAAQI